ncbi:hypothetical protein, conserved [Plasmodium gonderi]|uniref:Uncharacterized protein n=1 Tax=Plasmodium gonderi TaxID=77519 RepID=A0A1Y1JG32_PLAGO|nr:hypothetical protein, conserved [Plasmodium gonderi]GAW80167.1 hypothetical protein, conserved [Plasmodium gonderi]
MRNSYKTEISKNNFNLFGSFYSDYTKKDNNDEIITSEQTAKEENHTDEKNNRNQISRDSNTNATTSSPSTTTTTINNNNVISTNNNNVEGEHELFMEKEQGCSSNKNFYKSAKLFYDSNVSFETNTKNNKDLLDKNYFTIAHSSIFPVEEGYLYSVKEKKNEKIYETDRYIDNNGYKNNLNKNPKFLDSFQNIDGSDDYDTLDIFGINKPKPKKGYTSISTNRKFEKNNQDEEEEDNDVIVEERDEVHQHEVKEEEQLKSSDNSKTRNIHHELECESSCSTGGNLVGEEKLKSERGGNHNNSKIYKEDKHIYDEKTFYCEKYLLKNFFSKISKCISNKSEEEGGKYEKKEIGSDDKQSSTNFNKKCGGSLISYHSPYELKEYLDNKKMKSPTEMYKSAMDKFDTLEKFPFIEEKKNMYEITNEIIDKGNKNSSHKNDNINRGVDQSYMSYMNQYANTINENKENASEENRSSNYNSTRYYHYIRNMHQSNEDLISESEGNVISQRTCHALANGDEETHTNMMKGHDKSSEKEIKEEMNNTMSKKEGYQMIDHQHNEYLFLDDPKHFSSINYSKNQEESEIIQKEENLHKYYSMLQKLPKKGHVTSSAVSNVYQSDENNNTSNIKGNCTVNNSNMNDNHERNENSGNRDNNSNDICISDDNNDGKKDDKDDDKNDDNNEVIFKSSLAVENNCTDKEGLVSADDDGLTNDNSYPHYANQNCAWNKINYEKNSYSRVNSQQGNNTNNPILNSNTLSQESISVDKNKSDNGGEDVSMCVKQFGHVKTANCEHSDVSPCFSESLKGTCNPYINQRALKKEILQSQYEDVCRINSKYDKFTFDFFKGEKQVLNSNKENIIKENNSDEKCGHYGTGSHKGNLMNVCTAWNKREEESDVDAGEEFVANEHENEREEDDEEDDEEDEGQNDDFLFPMTPQDRPNNEKYEVSHRMDFNVINKMNTFDCNQDCSFGNCTCGNFSREIFCQNTDQLKCEHNCYHNQRSNQEQIYMNRKERILSGNMSDGENNIENNLINIRNDKKTSYSNPFNLSRNIAYNLYRTGNRNYFLKKSCDHIEKENYHSNIVKNYFDMKLKENNNGEIKSTNSSEQNVSSFKGAFISIPNMNNLNGQNCSTKIDVYGYNNKKEVEDTVDEKNSYDEIDYTNGGLGAGAVAVSVGAGGMGGGGGNLMSRLVIDSTSVGIPSSTVMTQSSAKGTVPTAGSCMTSGASSVGVGDYWVNRQKISVSNNKIEIIRKNDINCKRRIIDSSRNMISNKYMKYYSNNNISMLKNGYYMDSHSKFNGLEEKGSNNRNLKISPPINSLMPIDKNNFSNICTKVSLEKTHGNLCNNVIDLEKVQENKCIIHKQLSMTNKSKNNFNDIINLDDVYERKCEFYKRNVVDCDWRKEKMMNKKSTLLNFYNDMEDRGTNSLFSLNQNRDKLTNYIIDVDKVYEDKCMMSYDPTKRSQLSGAKMEETNVFKSGSRTGSRTGPITGIIKKSGSMNNSKLDSTRGERKLNLLLDCDRERGKQHHLIYNSSNNYKMILEKYNKSSFMNNTLDFPSTNKYPSASEYIINKTKGSIVGNCVPKDQTRSGNGNGTGRRMRGRGRGRRCMFYNKYPVSREQNASANEMGGDEEEYDSDENYTDDENARSEYLENYNKSNRRRRLSKAFRDQHILFSRNNNAIPSRKLPHASFLHRRKVVSEHTDEEDDSDYYIYNKYGFRKKKKKKSHLAQSRRGRGRNYNHHRTLNEDSLCNENELEKISQIENIISKKMKKRICGEGGEGGGNDINSSNNSCLNNDEDAESDLYNNIEFDRIKIENILDGTLKLDNKGGNIINNILELERRKYTINCIMDKLRKRENTCECLNGIEKELKHKINSNICDLYSDKTTYNIYSTKMCVNYFLEEKMHSPENKEFIKNFFVEKNTKNIYFVQIFKKKKKRKKKNYLDGNHSSGVEIKVQMSKDIGSLGPTSREEPIYSPPNMQHLPNYMEKVDQVVAEKNEKKYDMEEDEKECVQEFSKQMGGEVTGEVATHAVKQAADVEEEKYRDDSLNLKKEHKMNYFSYQLNYIKRKFYSFEKDEMKKEEQQQEIQQQQKQEKEEQQLLLPKEPTSEKHENQKIEMSERNFEFSVGNFVSDTSENKTDHIGEVNILKGAKEEEQPHDERKIIETGEILDEGNLLPNTIDSSGTGNMMKEKHPREQIENGHHNEDEIEDYFVERDNLSDQVIGISKNRDDKKKGEREHSIDSVINEEMVENEENKYGKFSIQEHLYSVMKMPGAQIIIGDEDEEEDYLDEYDDNDDDDEEEGEEEEDEEDEEEEEEEEEEKEQEQKKEQEEVKKEEDNLNNANMKNNDDHNHSNNIDNNNDSVKEDDIFQAKEEKMSIHSNIQEPMKHQMQNKEETRIAEEVEKMKENNCDVNEEEQQEASVKRECHGENEDIGNHRKEVQNFQNDKSISSSCLDYDQGVGEKNYNEQCDINGETRKRNKVKEFTENFEEKHNQKKECSHIKIITKNDKNEDEFEEVIEKRSCTVYRNKHNSNENYYTFDNPNNVKKEHENFVEHNNHGIMNEYFFKKEEECDNTIEESNKYKQCEKTIVNSHNSNHVKEENEGEKERDNNIFIENKQLIKSTLSGGNSISNLNGKFFFIKDMLHENNQYVHDCCDLEDNIKYKTLDILKKNQIEKIKKKIKKNKKLTKEDFKLLSELLHHKFLLNEIRAIGNYEVNYKNCFDILELEEYKLRKDVLNMDCDCLTIGLTEHEKEFLHEFQLFMPDINIMGDKNILYILRHSKNDNNCVFKCFLDEKKEQEEEQQKQNS